VRDLRKEPLFLEALRIATTMIHSGPRELFQPAATYSAEFNASKSSPECWKISGRMQIASPVFTDFEDASWLEDASE